MRKDIRLRHDAHVRTNRVCTEHRALFDATAGGQKTRMALGTYVTDVDRQLALQDQSVEERRAATEMCRQKRAVLHDAAIGVVKIGKLVNVDDDTMATMQLPAGRTDDERLSYAQGLLDRVSSHAGAFADEGLPSDVLKNLGDAILGLKAAKNAQAKARQQFAGATASIRETQDKADKTIDALDAIAVNTPAAHPAVLTKLRIAKRVGPRPPEPAAKPAPSPAPPSTTDKVA